MMGTRLGRRLRPGPGPVFIYESVTAARRWQGYALRSCFVLSLLAALLAIGMRQGAWEVTTTLSGLAELGEKLFVAVIGTQLTLVLLAAPAATAGAICLDRARGTLTHLLVTDLSDGEIVLGKLAARLAPVLGLVACTLPVMELLTLLGGVDPDALLGAFVVTLGVAGLGCSMALVFSLWAGRTHEAVLGTYAVWGLWLLGEPMISQVNRTMGWSLSALQWKADPFRLAFAPYWAPGRVAWDDYAWFLGVTWSLSAMLAGLAVARLRAVCMREVVRKRASRVSRLGPALERFLRVPYEILGWAGPTLDFNPVLWREWHRNRPARWARIVAALFVAVAASYSVIAIISGRGETRPWVNAFQVSIGLLFLSVTAAVSLAEERARGSLDVLMTTPLLTWQIVAGKWLGCYRLVPLLTVLPALVAFGATGLNPTGWPGVMLIVIHVLCTGAAIASLGLAMATWCPRLGRAVGLTVTFYLLMAVGWLFWTMIGWERGLMMGSPFFWAGQMTADLDRPSASASEDHFGWGVFWIEIYALAAVALFVATLATFNWCVGRVDPIFGRRSRPAPAAIERPAEPGG